MNTFQIDSNTDIVDAVMIIPIYIHFLLITDHVFSSAKFYFVLSYSISI